MTNIRKKDSVGSGQAIASAGGDHTRKKKNMPNIQ